MAVTERLGRDVEPRRMITNYIYFYHLDQFCVLPVYPESITDNMTSNFQSANALGRSAPVWSYANSGPRTIEITLDLHRDLMNDLNTNVSNFKDNVVPFKSKYDEDGVFQGNDYIDTLIKYLLSIALPKYRIYNNGSKSVEPPMVAVRFGDEIFIKGIVNSGVRVTYQMPLITDKNGNQKYAKVQIGFTVTETDPYDAESVLQLGSFRGICGTNNIYSSNSITDKARFGNYNRTQRPTRDAGSNFIVEHYPGLHEEYRNGLEIDTVNETRALARLYREKPPYINYVSGEKVQN